MRVSPCTVTLSLPHEKRGPVGKQMVVFCDCVLGGRGSTLLEEEVTKWTSGLTDVRQVEGGRALRVQLARVCPGCRGRTHSSQYEDSALEVCTDRKKIQKPASV